MSQQNNIVVYDGNTTPAIHTVVPESIEKIEGLLTAMWKESLTGVPDYAQIRVMTTKRKLKSGVWRVEARVMVPVMEAVSGVNAQGYTAPPKIAHIPACGAVGFFDPRSTVTERRLVRQMVTNLLGGISTSVVPVTTGPIAELFDQLIFVS